ncbi:hypothetical protein [Shewanella sp.]|uniref:hypothetical protein n=1 Tax=Shewanella sp. TaxID=50422 RepID=UPI003A972A36
MDWEAFFAVGAVMLVLAMVLLVPGLMLGRRLSNSAVNAFFTLRPTIRLAVFMGFGWLLSALAAAVVGYFAPSSSRGQWIATPSDLFSLIFVPLILVEKLLQACGINLLDDGKK